MDEISSRQRQILGIAREAGRVSVEELALRFDVTPQTIRKDLNELCDRRFLARVHGGAVLASSVENVGYEARRFVAQDEKQRIGRAAAQLVANHSSLFINIGTTTEEVAKALTDHDGLLVITNNLHVAAELYRHPRIEVILAGGTVRRSDGGIIGAATVEFIRQFKVDTAVIGASAIDADGTLLDFDYREVRVSRAIIESARRVILVADRLKFERSAPVRIAHLEEIDVFVTDHIPSEDLKAMFEANRVEVVEVGGHPGRVSED
ncbi:MAG TPA: DeoR/GlpR family DNA-binding transcription regulator [Ferrovibrio sp.]|uniref:DeoR/GlpR family DNA-binding transcription regulator n=1 Tax=Ferrovibrio sp. TaxID=1917215 RepID=UPI002ED36D26